MTNNNPVELVKISPYMVASSLAIRIAEPAVHMKVRGSYKFKKIKINSNIFSVLYLVFYIQYIYIT